jgi:TPP-dependent pyruvate/acetoin dehydrogenase alpha subunit
MNKEELIKFTEEVAELYKAGKIHAPIHLGGENEDNLIEIFKNITSSDWIFSTWRSHYCWLLSGKSPSELLQQIMDGHSMHVYGDRFFTSAIVGGIAPIAVGTAYALKLKMSKDRVWCFLGDMGASTGIAMESMRYACGHDLPITFVIEDNGLSVRTDTLESWGCKNCRISNCNLIGKKCQRYEYVRKYNHAGYGLNGEKGWVLF